MLEPILVRRPTAETASALIADKKSEKSRNWHSHSASLMRTWFASAEVDADTMHRLPHRPMLLANRSPSVVTRIYITL
jgi:hypothetical protein